MIGLDELNQHDRNLSYCLLLQGLVNVHDFPHDLSSKFTRVANLSVQLTPQNARPDFTTRPDHALGPHRTHGAIVTDVRVGSIPNNLHFDVFTAVVLGYW